MNRIIAGDYKGSVSVNFGKPVLVFPMFKTMKINKDTVEEYEVLDERSKTSSTSALGRATLGALILGPVGLAAALGAKSKNTYYVALRFKDDKKCLLEVDGDVYKAIMKALFGCKISGEEAKEEPKESNISVSAESASSELKNYKELLDSGAISESEYSSLKRSLLGSHADVDEEPVETRKITIKRIPKMLACGAVYDVKLDGDTIGSLKNGKSLDTTGTVGKHKVTISSSAALGKNKEVGELSFLISSTDRTITLNVETLSLSKVTIGREF